SKNPNSYYPGSSKVDIIGSDGYNWACTLHNKINNQNKNGCGSKGWRSFQQVFEATNTWANSVHSPWWVTEVGVAEDPNSAGRKAQWFTGMENFLESHQGVVGNEESWAGMQGFIYYQGGVNAPVFNIGTSASSLAAY